MNIFSYPLLSAMSIAVLGFSALPQAVFAYEENYGAGFWASPSAYVAPSTNYFNVTPNNYGAGFYGSPTLSYDPNAYTSTISASNYGRGFYASPALAYDPNAFGSTFHANNYGAGFYGSPVLVGGSPYSTVSTG